MKIFKYLIITVCGLFISNPNCSAQDVSFEKIKEICEGVDRKERIRVSVIRFSSQMNTRDHNQLGDELAAMLENALFKVNCFNVLASASDKKDFDDEYSWTNGGYTNNTGAQKGNLMGAQAIITGEITEYAEGQKKGGALGVNIQRSKAHVGFVLQVKDPMTREMLFSESIDMEGKSTGFNGASLFGLQVAGSSDRSAALNDAVEKAIIKATEVLANSKDEWGIEDSSNSAGKNRVLVSLQGADFSSLMTLTNQIKGDGSTQSADMNMSDGVGFINVITTLNNQDLAVKLNTLANGYEIIGLDNGGVQLKKK